MPPYKLNYENATEKRQAQNFLTMIKEKRDSKLKGRTVADGRK